MYILFSTDTGTGPSIVDVDLSRHRVLRVPFSISLPVRVDLKSCSDSRDLCLVLGSVDQKTLEASTSSLGGPTPSPSSTATSVSTCRRRYPGTTLGSGSVLYTLQSEVLGDDIRDFGGSCTLDTQLWTHTHES